MFELIYNSTEKLEMKTNKQKWDLSCFDSFAFVGLAESVRSADEIQFQSASRVNGADQITFYGMMFFVKSIYFF